MKDRDTNKGRNDQNQRRQGMDRNQNLQQNRGQQQSNVQSRTQDEQSFARRDREQTSRNRNESRGRDDIPAD